MNKKNRGKQFEDVIKEAFEAVPDTEVYRIPDQMSYKVGSKNPCDFFIYHKPILCAIECKATNNPSLPFSNITEFQWESLLKMSSVSGVVAGIMCWYVNAESTLFLPIKLLEILKQNGAKSVRYDADALGIVHIKGTKKRTFYEYDMLDFFNSIYIS